MKAKKPEKYIKLFHLGFVPPVAYFGDNQHDAILSVQLLNKEILMKEKVAINVKALLDSKFYYLTGHTDNEEFCHYVDMHNAPIISNDHRFLTRIAALDPDRRLPGVELELPPDPADEYKKGNHGGRKNPKNKKK